MKRLLLFILFICPLALHSQSSFLIPVQTTTGQGISGATVTLTCTDTTNGCVGKGPFSATSTNGNAAFTAIPAGNYTVAITGPNLTTFLYAYTVGSPPLGLTGASGATVCGTYGVICVDGVTYAKTNAGIQQAVNATPSGGTVFLPSGTYVLSGAGSEQIKITQSIDFKCAGWGSILQVASTVGATPIIHIVPVGGIGGVRIEDCTIQGQAQSSPGSYAIQIDTSPNNNIGYVVIEHNQLGQIGVGNVGGTNGGMGSGAIWLNNTAGEVNGGIFFSWIEHNYISNGILGTLIGDGVMIQRNLIQGNGNSIDVTFTAGSANFHVIDNTINPKTGAAIHTGSGPSFMAIVNNEIETPNSTGTGSNGAFVDIDSTMASPAFYTNIDHNSFQMVSGTSLNTLRINNSNFANITNNWFQRGTGTSSFTIANSPTGATESVNTVTITTTATCNFTTGQIVTVSGVGVSGYNGQWQVLTPGCNGGSSFTYTNPTGSLAASGGGTAVSGAVSIVTTANATKTRIRPNNFNGDVVSNALFDGAAPGTTLREWGGQNDTSIPLVYRDNSGTTTYSGAGANPALQANVGNLTFYDGNANQAAQFSSSGAQNASILGIAKFAGIESVGTAATITGTGACLTHSTQHGGSWAGDVVCTGTTGAATLIITSGSNVTPANGWHCNGADTTAAHLLLGIQSGVSTASCTLSFTSVTANDVISFSMGAAY